jgi:hypothetical protein
VPSADVAALPRKIPGLGAPDDRSAEWSTPIPLAGLSILAEKIARGCEYKYKNRRRLVTPPYGIRTFIGESGPVPEPFASVSDILDFGPGCKIRRESTVEDPNIVGYRIWIWNTLYLKVVIALESELLKAEPLFRKSERIIPSNIRGMRISPYLRNVNQQGPGRG